MPKARKSSFISIICLILSLALFNLLKENVILRIDNSIYDIYFKYFIDEKGSKDIAIIEIDQGSLNYVKQNYGYGWPWPRKLYSDIISYLELSRAKTITLDLILSEQSVYGAEDDMYLQNITAEYDNIITVTDTAKSVALGIGNINSKTTHVGFSSQKPDKDGKFRTFKFYDVVGNQFIPSVSLTSYIVSQGKPSITNVIDDSGLSASGNMLKFRGPHGTYPSYRAGDILQSMEKLQQGKPVILSPKYFANKNIFIGSSAPGLLDLRPSPVDPLFNGVEILATAFDNIATKDFIKQIDLPMMHICSCILSIIILFFILNFQSIPCIVSCFSCVIFLALLSIILFKYNLWLPPTFLMVSLFAAIAIGISVTMFEAKKARDEIKKKFSHYLDKRVIKYFEQNHDKFVIGGDEKYISVLFTDIEGFSTISSHVAPDTLIKFLNEYLSIMTGVLLQHGAIIDKYEGDAIIAFWGSLDDCQNHESVAMQAVLDCRKELARRENDLQKLLGLVNVPIVTRFGLHAGRVIVGNIGTEGRFDYTIIGGNVNIASRLESANKILGTEILCSEAIANRIDDGVCQLRDLGYVRVVNISTPVHIYTVASDGLNNEIEEFFANGLRLFHDGEYEKSKNFFEKNVTDGPSRFYYEEAMSQGCHTDKFNNVRVVNLASK